MGRRRTAVLIAVVTASFMLAAPHASATTWDFPTPPTPPASVSDGTGPLDTAADLAAALRFEERLKDHYHYDQPYGQRYNTPEHVTGDIDILSGEPDAGLYTGAYLAASSYRWALARQELAAATPGSEAHDFWQQQFDDAYARVRGMVRKYHMLINIARGWQPPFNLQIHPDRDPLDRGIDFGGGIIPGEAGLLFRACNPSDAPDPLNFRRNLGPHMMVVTLPWEDGKTWDCVGNTSRDQYAGATHGLVTALDIVGRHDAEIRDMTAGDLMKMSDYAFKYLWFQPRPHGEVVVPELGGNDLTGPISPLFVHTSTAQMNLVQVARYAASVAGTQAQRDKWELIWLVELATELPQLALGMLVDSANPHDTQYKFHLNHLTGDNTIRFEPDNQVRNLLRQAFAVMDASTRDEGNALFEIMTYSLTGETERLNGAVTHHREWLEYHANAMANDNVIDYTGQCGTTYTCVPTDTVRVFQPNPFGNTIVFDQPGSDPRPRSVDPVPVPLRRPADFLWQKDSTIIIGCGGGVLPDCAGSELWEGPSVDFIQTYWAIRYYTEVDPPDSRDPFPTWLGPNFS